MKKQKISILSGVAVLVIILSVLSFQIPTVEDNLQTEIKSISHEKEIKDVIIFPNEQIISTFQETSARCSFKFRIWRGTHGSDESRLSHWKCKTLSRMASQTRSA